MIKFLSGPFPFVLKRKQVLILGIAAGLFVFLFLQIFQPFGLSQVRGELWQVTLTYGAITVAGIFIVEVLIILLFPGFYREDQWNVGKEFLHTILVILLITAGNILYSVQINFYSFSFELAVRFFGITLAIAIFPVSLQILIRQNIYQKKYLKRAMKLNDRIIPPSNIEEKEVTQFHLKDEEGKVMLELSERELLAVESADNYAKVYFLKNNGLQNQLIRNSLKFFESQLKAKGDFYRCHRSYLVNLHKLKKVKGDARGYRLVLHPELKEIPLARRRSVEFGRVMNNRASYR